MLRPRFTQQLADTLLAGEHVNLFSPHGRGRRRTLADLRMLLPHHVQTCQIDLKRQQDMWQIWLEEVLVMSGQVIVIIHNIEYITAIQVEKFLTLRKFTLLYVSEQPLFDHDIQNIELPVYDSTSLI